MTRGRYERIQLQLSQKEVAWLAQVPQPVVSLLETGVRTWHPSPEQIAAIARVLRVHPPEALLEEVEVVR